MHPTRNVPDDIVRVLMPLSHWVCLSATVRLAIASAPLWLVPKLNRYVPLMSAGGGTDVPPVGAFAELPQPAVSNTSARIAKGFNLGSIYIILQYVVMRRFAAPGRMDKRSYPQERDSALPDKALNLVLPRPQACHAHKYLRLAQTSNHT